MLAVILIYISLLASDAVFIAHLHIFSEASI